MTPISPSGLDCFLFPNLAGYPGLRHGIFSRNGGVSLPPFHSLNVGFGTGDAPAHVAGNRDRISRFLGADELFFSHQVHGSDVITISRDTSLREPLSGDAMVTDLPGKYLAMKVADCQPVLLYDPVRRVIGAVHSGWRGSVLNVIGKTIDVMTGQYRCSPLDIQAGIGPSLGPCCAEFIHFQKELPESFWRYGTHGHRFDFWAASRDQLQACGVPEGNIHISGICTRCRTDLYFSYRKEKLTGRFAAVIGMEEI